MPITQNQIEQRKKHLGSSDIPALFGLSPWATPVDIWLEKTGRLEPEDEEKQKQWLERGRIFEAPVLDIAEAELGKLRRNQYRRANGYPIGSHTDAIVVANGRPVEAKTVGYFAPQKEQWGQEGTDEVPDYVLLQSMTHLICTKAEACHVVAYRSGTGAGFWIVKRDEELIRIIIGEAGDWWSKYITADIRPPDSTPSPDILKRRKRQPNKVISIPDELYGSYVAAAAKAKEAQAEADAIKTQITDALDDAEEGECTQGRVTYYAQSRTRIDKKRLEKEQPEIAAKYITQTSYRVLRVKQNKENGNG